MKKSYYSVVFTAILLVAGCKNQNNQPSLISSVPVDLMNPNGAYELVIYEAVKEAVLKLDLSKYKNSNLILDYENSENKYTDSVLRGVLTFELEKNGTGILNDSVKSSADVAGLKSDYILNVSAPVCGVYEYTGFARIIITGTVILDLIETDNSGKVSGQSSGTVTVIHEKTVLNQYALSSLWFILLFSLCGTAALAVYVKIIRR